jgi:hypothetical protein
MGGSLAVTLREPDGTEHRMCRWTNALPAFVNNMRLVNKDPAHIKKYVDRWTEMREDYEKHKGTKKFEFNMTDIYAPYPYLAPMDYGLVVIDMMKDQILSCQGYTNFGRFDIVGVAMDMSQVGLEDDESRDKLTKEFFDAKRAVIKKYVKQPKKEKYKLVDTDMTYEGMLLLIEQGNVEIDRIVALDMYPFSIHHYKEGSEKEWLKMRKDIEDLGFKITAEEDKMWKEFLEELKEMNEGG